MGACASSQVAQHQQQKSSAEISSAALLQTAAESPHAAITRRRACDMLPVKGSAISATKQMPSSASTGALMELQHARAIVGQPRLIADQRSLHWRRKQRNAMRL
eukprot:gnl/TRDRNA2_/TRDRNA2_181898_c0_seq1.p1 gnl/TRDRNA2_/TRDRNA2_181898_c0~~gnl/TRDRNA2_/TRDRNA2_181898_c0_seq1.p1  ORF type:complete len:104 (-),score=18.70 gnl/TRDRNA2_/TRDRNA2_181898_c0_seq1:317-628(-)